MSAKGPAYFQILSCYFIDVRLKLLCVKFALNSTNLEEISKENSDTRSPTLFILKRGQSLQGQIP